MSMPVTPWLRRFAETLMDASSMGSPAECRRSALWPMLANLEQSFHYGRLHRYLRFCQDVRSSHVDLYGFRLLVRIRFASGSQRVRIWFASSHLVRIWFASRFASGLMLMMMCMCMCMCMCMGMFMSLCMCKNMGMYACACGSQRTKRGKRGKRGQRGKRGKRGKRGQRGKPQL